MSNKTREELYYERNEQRASKVLKKSTPQRATIEPIYFKDISEKDRHEYE